MTKQPSIAVTSKTSREQEASVGRAFIYSVLSKANAVRKCMLCVVLLMSEGLDGCQVPMSPDEERLKLVFQLCFDLCFE